jgi:large subunit ribosomal protein L18
MSTEIDTRAARERRHERVRRRIRGDIERPRLCVFRSLNHIYAQVVDDAAGHTLASASSLDGEIRTGLKETARSKKDVAEMVGSLVAKRAQEKGIGQVVFDRGGYKYHGRVKSLADGARSGGLKF